MSLPPGPGGINVRTCPSHATSRRFQSPPAVASFAEPITWKPPVVLLKGLTGRTTGPRGGASMRHIWLAALARAIAIPSAGRAQRAPDLRKPAPPTVVGPADQ